MRVARVTGSGGGLDGWWVQILGRRGKNQSRIRILDGRSDARGDLIDNAHLGSEFQAEDGGFDEVSGQFSSYPVRILRGGMAYELAGPDQGELEVGMVGPQTKAQAPPQVQSQPPAAGSGPLVQGVAGGMVPVASSTYGVSTSASHGVVTSGMGVPIGSSSPCLPGSISGSSVTGIAGYTSVSIPIAGGVSMSGAGTAVTTPQFSGRSSSRRANRVRSPEEPQPAGPIPIIPLDTLGDLIDTVPLDLSLMLWGAPGVGKSAGVKEYCRAKGLKLFDLRIPLLEPIDLRGIGVPDLTADGGRGACRWLAPAFLPRESDGECILFLDEVTAATPMMQSACYQLTLDRKIGEYELPASCRVLLAGNRETDRGVAFKMPSPLANRILHLEVRPEIGPWRKWAMGAGIDHRIIAFVSTRPDIYLHHMTPETAGQAWPSPRSWHHASRLLASDPEGDLLEILVGSCVGREVAYQFAKFQSKLENYIDPLLILSSNEEACRRRRLNISEAATLAVAVAAHVENEVHMDRACRCARTMNSEIGQILVRTLEERWGRERLLGVQGYVEWQAVVAASRNLEGGEAGGDPLAKMVAASRNLGGTP